jgi:hypothetical protein
MMNCYEYTVLRGGHIATQGTLHAQTDAGAEARLKREVLPLWPAGNQYYIKQLVCSCGSDNDVTDFYDQEKRLVLCVDCRYEYIVK